MRERGLIREGLAADLLLFDPRTVGRGPKRRVFDLPGGRASPDHRRGRRSRRVGQRRAGRRRERPGRADAARRRAADPFRPLRASRRRVHATRLRGRAVAALVAATCVPALAQTDEPRRNAFDDPFLQATHAIAGVPSGRRPAPTAAEVRAQSHLRAEGNHLPPTRPLPAAQRVPLRQGDRAARRPLHPARPSLRGSRRSGS